MLARILFTDFALLFLATSVASSQSIRIFFDPEIRACSAIVRPFHPVLLHVVFLSGADVPAITGAQFRITGLPETWTPQNAFWAPAPEVAITLGNPLFPNYYHPAGGVNVTFGECHGDNDPPGDVEPVLLGTILINAIDAPENVILRVENAPLFPWETCPLITGCEYPTLPTACVAGGEFYINSTTDCIANPRLTTVDLLQFPPVTVGDTTTAGLALRNTGNVALLVREITVQTPIVRVPVEVPFSLQSGESRTIPISLRPNEIGDTLGDLTIRSSSLLDSVMSVALRATILDLEVEARPLVGQTAPAPLGTPYVVLVLPKPLVRVERGSLHYRSIARMPGGDGPFVAVSLLASSADSASILVGTIPGADVTEAGLEFYISVQNSQIFRTVPTGAPQDSLLSQVVGLPTLISAITQPAGGPFQQGEEVEVFLGLETGTIFQDGQLFYRLAGTADYESTTVSVVPGVSAPRATIPGRALDPRGLEFWVRARTVSRVLTDPPSTPQTSPKVVQVSVESLVEDRPHSGQRYRLLSIPLYYSSQQSLSDVLGDPAEFGPYDPKRWRVYRYEPSTKENVELPKAKSSEFVLEPGRAFWLISRDMHQVDTAPLVGLSTPRGAAHAILLEQGWNAFGNPFAFPVAWNMVSKSDSNWVGEPVAFDSECGTLGDYAPCGQPHPAHAVPPILIPFDGYFIQNNSAHVETLWVPPVEATELQMVQGQSWAIKKPSLRVQNLDSWSARLQAQTEQGLDGSNVLGVEPEAQDGFDRLDQGKPPASPGPWVRVGFVHEDWGSRSGLFRRDLRKPGREGHEWEVEVRSHVKGEEVTLELVFAAEPPNDLLVRVVDREMGVSQNLLLPGGKFESYQMLSYGPERPYRLVLVAGTAGYVAQEEASLRTLPLQVELNQNVPNPFNAVTRIRFGLPDPALVRLAVYNVRGERVAVLRRGEEPAGHHVLLWRGTDDRGQSVGSGVYFCRLETGSTVLTRRLVLLK